MTTIAICGGIGSGKSVVAAIVRAMGYTVYDTDSEARRLMDSSPEIKRRIAAEISADAVVDGVIIRPHLAQIVFSDHDALARLNSIVHSAVREDFINRRSRLRGEILFIESAILFESGFDSLADAVWEVTAPDALRVERVMKRNGLSRAEVESRVATQAVTACGHSHPRLSLIVNDGVEPVLPQVTNLLQNL